MIRTCIVDTRTNVVVNIIDYDEEMNGVPPGLDDFLLCVPSATGQIGGTFENGVIVNPEIPPLSID